MFGVTKIGLYFNYLREERAKKAASAAAVQKLEETVRTGDPAQVAQELGEARKSEYFTGNDFAGLVRAALKRDDVAVFRALLPDNPNYFFEEQMIAPETLYTSKQYVLTAALGAGAASIALDLALDPKTDVTARGYTQMNLYRTERYTQDPLPVEQAKSLNMPAVEAALANRMAALYLAQASKAKPSIG